MSDRAWIPRGDIPQELWDVERESAELKDRVEQLEGDREAWKSRALHEVEVRQAIERDLRDLMFKHAIPNEDNK